MVCRRRTRRQYGPASAVRERRLPGFSLRYPSYLFALMVFFLREPGSTSLESALVSHGAARWNRAIISGAGVAGPDNAAMKALNPAGLIRIGAVSISTSSAARTAASRTKSVRDRPRSVAAR